jgi:hypothetical protein
MIKSYLNYKLTNEDVLHNIPHLINKNGTRFSGSLLCFNVAYFLLV